MSDAYNAGAWILGELDSTVAGLKNNFFKPVKIKMDNVDAVNIGDPVDMWLNHISPAMLKPIDESGLVGPTSSVAFFPTDLHRLVDNGDGTKTAIFFSTTYAYKYTLNEELVTVNYERVNLYAYLGFTSSTGVGSLYDCWVDEETGEEWFLNLSAIGSATANAYLHRKKGDATKTYSVTLPGAYLYSREGTSNTSASGKAHPRCSGKLFQRLSDDIFVISAGDHIVMVQLNEASMTAIILADHTLPVLKEAPNYTVCRLYADTDAKRIYAIAHGLYFKNGSKNYASVEAFVLTYDLGNYFFTELNHQRVFDNGTNTTTIYTTSVQGDKLYRNGNKKTVQTVFELGATPHLYFIDFDNDDNISSDSVTLGASGDTDYRIAPISVDVDTVIYSLLTSSACYAVKARRGAPRKSFSMVLPEEGGDMYRLTRVGNDLMAFLGYPRNADGYSGFGKQTTLHRKPIEMGIVIDTDASAGEVEVAQTGICEITVSGAAGKTVSMVGGTYTYIGENLIEL